MGKVYPACDLSPIFRHLPSTFGYLIMHYIFLPTVSCHRPRPATRLPFILLQVNQLFSNPSNRISRLPLTICHMYLAMPLSPFFFCIVSHRYVRPQMPCFFSYLLHIPCNVAWAGVRLHIPGSVTVSSRQTYRI